MTNNTRKNIISTVITVLILFAGIFLFQALSNQKKSTLGDTIQKNERRKVQVNNFESKSVANTIEIDGRLRAQERVNVTSKVQGLMQAGPRSIRVGKYFKKGELLYTIDSKEASFNLKAQKSALVTAITQIMPDIKFDYPESFDNWEKYLNDFDVNKNIKPFPTPTNNQERYFIDGRNLNNLYYQIKSLETHLKDYNIYAPFSGVITATNIYPGALISPGQVLCSMINTSYFELTSPVQLEELKYIKVGQKVNLYSDGLGETWKGEVARIGTILDESTQNIPIYISVKGKGLKDGIYLKGELSAGELDNVIELPKNIFLSPNTIFTVVDSTLTVKEITPIKRKQSDVIVTGLSSDESVVTGSLVGLFAGQKVNY